MKIFVKVKAGAGENKVEQIDAMHYHVTVTELPVRGQANTAVVKILAKHLNLAPSLLTITCGQTAKQKTIHIHNSHQLF